MREKCILLRTVEAMNLVYEEDRLPAELQAFLGFGNDFADARNALRDCREWYERPIGITRYQTADRRFP